MDVLGSVLHYIVQSLRLSFLLELKAHLLGWRNLRWNVELIHSLVDLVIWQIFIEHHMCFKCWRQSLRRRSLLEFVSRLKYTGDKVVNKLIIQFRVGVNNALES